MKTEHTKGPWRTEGFENLVVNSAEGYTMTLAAGGKDACLDELKANARLIAAAPELLDALRELCADKYLSDPINLERMKNARAAISKAEGNA